MLQVLLVLLWAGSENRIAHCRRKEEQENGKVEGCLVKHKKKRDEKEQHAVPGKLLRAQPADCFYFFIHFPFFVRHINLHSCRRPCAYGGSSNLGALLFCSPCEV